MTDEQKIQAFLAQGRRAMLDFIIDCNPALSAQSVNMQSLVLTDAELAGWALSVSNELREAVIAD
ncbi:hypothetical protein [Lacticaseibacillus saniviri]|uniref:Uncharacterized protein n=1 Tax=Lacticaseibacillus saniviri JCM 17471 = DSM 24301 TaxID=1293598 RepID=A0A0R2MQ82_9LACO|nr:hypothetical protein [Lacticaseibacillus saniviri]KRO15785.1 hypothetical protein IV56_GL002146 [Lacticaseibacillus saniviri JCM 17471 = DSM 24301]